MKIRRPFPRNLTVNPHTCAPRAVENQAVSPASSIPIPPECSMAPTGGFSAPRFFAAGVPSLNPTSQMSGHREQPKSRCRLASGDEPGLQRHQMLRALMDPGGFSAPSIPGRQSPYRDDPISGSVDSAHRCCIPRRSV